MFDETLENDRMLKGVAVKYAGEKARELLLCSRRRMRYVSRSSRHRST
jgi:hypothetical protein